MLKVIKKVGNARLCDFETVHGTIHTPAFMNVATAGAIKGGLSAVDLENIETQVMLCNTYHLHVRPGDDLIHDLGGLHKFTGWSGPILTDSGGFQVFSLAKLRKIKEEGVSFNSHVEVAVFLWDRKKVCKYNLIWALPLPWLLTSVLKILPNIHTPNSHAHEL